MIFHKRIELFNRFCREPHFGEIKRILPNSINIFKIGLICSCGEMHIGGFGKIELALALGGFVSNGDRGKPDKGIIFANG